MDYFAVGGRPFLSRFPPHIPQLGGHLSQSQRSALNQQQQQGGNQHTGLGSWFSGATGASQNAGQQQHGQSEDEARRVGHVDQPGAPPWPQTVNHPASAPQGSRGAADGSYAQADSEADTGAAEIAFHQAYPASEVQVWPADRFEVVRKLMDATRNRGTVSLMRDTAENRLVAVKQMPNRWVRSCHQDFILEHPSETELPWQDIGCVRFLNSRHFVYACQLVAVYRDEVHTYVVTSFATEGDLFSWCETGGPPGLAREIEVRALARQIFQSVQQLHDLSITHRDLSLENILLNKAPDSSLQIHIIDFGMASNKRRFQNCVRGKASYQAPEMHLDAEYDAFLSDAFSLGVTLYAVLLKDYPWLSTRQSGCKCFEYIRKHGFRSYIEKRKLRNSSMKVVDCMSEPLKALLEGLLQFDPAQRLTLGEKVWAGTRRSVWDEPWLQLDGS